MMLIIPVLLSFVITGSTIYVYTEIKGVDNGSTFGGANLRQYYESVEAAKGLINKWSWNTDLNQMKTDIDSFNEKYRNMNNSLAIYKGKELVYPSISFSSSPILDMALSRNNNHTFVMDDVAVYRDNVGEYNIVLILDNFATPANNVFINFRSNMFQLAILILIFVVVIILITNRFLTSFVFKRIVTPLDILVYGVHQIRDGNLDYHIDYDGKDEFAEVCSDFNEMAQRLLESVNARQKDETNRRALIAGISHDLRTPLTSIKAYVEGIEKGVAATPELQKRYLETIKNKTKDLEYIVNQLFLFSKLDIGEFPFHLEQVNIGKELSHMLTFLSEEYEKKGLSIVFERNISNVYVQADIVQLRNVITNVLENSVKYKNKEQVVIKVKCAEEGKYVVITLSDNGPGVPSEAVDKLFDIFYRTDSSRHNPSSGSGLGLAITAKILERIGGSIRAENVEEGGLAIIMTLPRYK